MQTIAFNTAAQSSTTGTSLTFSHTTSTGASRMLFVGALTNASSGGDVVTGITYGGVAMTRINTNGVGGQRVYLYYLANPASGANNVVISASASGALYGASATYTGARQSTIPDSHNTGTNASATSLTVATTVVAADSWLVMAGRGTSGTIEAGAGTTLRNDSKTLVQIYDSNEAKAAGSRSLQITSTETQGLIGCIASFAPAPDIANSLFYQQI